MTVFYILSVIGLSVVCIALAHEITELQNRFTKLAELTNNINRISLDHFMQLSKSLGDAKTSTNQAFNTISHTMEEMFEWQKEQASELERVSHETNEIRRYYCNYVSKKVED